MENPVLATTSAYQDALKAIKYDMTRILRNCTELNQQYYIAKYRDNNKEEYKRIRLIIDNYKKQYKQLKSMQVVIYDWLFNRKGECYIYLNGGESK